MFSKVLIYSYESASLVETLIALRAGIRLANHPKTKVVIKVIQKPLLLNAKRRETPLPSIRSPKKDEATILRGHARSNPRAILLTLIIIPSTINRS